MGFGRVVIATCLACALPNFANPGTGVESDRSPALFSSTEVLKLTLEAPFDDLLAKIKQDSEASIKGTLKIGDSVIKDVQVSIRGHTSMEPRECSFPKLKLRFAEPPDLPLLAGMEAVKIGTHCGDRPENELTPKYGRLANARSPHREAFVYRLLATLGIPTLQARPAEITYVSTGDASGPPLVRSAFLLEDDDEAMKRFGAVGQIEPPDFESASTVFQPAETARLAFAEAMIGNFDWCLKFTPDDQYRCDAHKRLWNVFAFRKADGAVVPVMYDFDIAGMVVGRHNWFARVFNESFVPSKSHAYIEVLSQVQRTRSLFPRALLDATRRSFLERKAEAYGALEGGVLDEEGKRHVRDYLTAFYDAIESDEAFYVPVVIREGTRAFSDSAGTQPVCGNLSTIPVGTPVSQPLGRDGNMVQIVLLDALWRWAPPVRCETVQNSSVWIATDAIDANYPQ